MAHAKVIFDNNLFFDSLFMARVPFSDWQQTKKRIDRNESFACGFYEDGGLRFVAVFDEDRTAINVRHVVGSFGKRYHLLDSFSRAYAMFKEKNYITLKTERRAVKKWCEKMGYKTNDGTHFYKRVELKSIIPESFLKRADQIVADHRSEYRGEYTMNGGKSSSSTSATNETTTSTATSTGTVGDVVQGQTISITQEFPDQAVEVFKQLVEFATGAGQAAVDVVKKSNETVAAVTGKAAQPDLSVIESSQRTLYYVLGAVAVAFVAIRIWGK